MKKIIYITLVAIITLLTVGCGDSSEKTDDNGNIIKTGSITGHVNLVGSEGKESIIVVIYDNETKKETANTIKVATGRDKEWKYNIKAPYGRYMVCAFVDNNKDEKLTFGEVWGCNETMVDLSEDNTQAERTVEISSQ